MGILFSKLLTLFFAPTELKILILGLDNSGKSTILYRLSLGSAVSTTPTLGANVEELTYRNLKVVMWDLGGQSSLRASWAAYYSGARAVVMVVDSTDRERMGTVKSELGKIMAHDVGLHGMGCLVGLNQPDRRVPSQLLKKSSLLVFANKQDVKGAMTAAEVPFPPFSSSSQLTLPLALARLDLTSPPTSIHQRPSLDHPPLLRINGRRPNRRTGLGNHEPRKIMTF